MLIGEIEESKRHLYVASKYIHEDSQHLGIDIDGVITEWPDFFKDLSRSWPGRVSIITYRPNKESAEKLLLSLGVYYDDIHLVSGLDKSEKISELGIDVYIDDQDECTLNIPSTVAVLKVRNGGNYKDGKWLYSNETGRSLPR